MKLRLILIISVMLFLMNGCDLFKTEDPSLKVPKKKQLSTMEDSMNYILGMAVSEKFSQFNEDDYQLELIRQGVEDGIEGKKKLVPPEEKLRIFQRYFAAVTEFKNDSILRQSVAWLKENEKKEGVYTTIRGLQYTFLHQGSETGLMPDGNDLVQIRYVQGTPQHGILWDQSMATNKRDTIEMAINREVSGFSEACQLMREGDKIRAWLPPNIGSAEGAPDPAGITARNEVILMEIELLKVRKRTFETMLQGEAIHYPGFFSDESQRY